MLNILRELLIIRDKLEAIYLAESDVSVNRPIAAALAHVNNAISAQKAIEAEGCDETEDDSDSR